MRSAYLESLYLFTITKKITRSNIGVNQIQMS
jgi:hypothetical protein